MKSHSSIGKTDSNVLPLPQTQYSPREFKLIALRECATSERDVHIVTPADAVRYWRNHIEPTLSPVVENLVVIALGTRRRIRGHQIVAVGSETEVAVCVREVFRLAVTLGAASIIVAHNHPGGTAEPSQQDRDLCQVFDDAGRVLGIEHLDSLVIGNGQFASLKGFGGAQAGVAVQDKGPAAQLVTTLPDDLAGWNQIVEFIDAEHPDLWLSPADQFYLAADYRMVPIAVKEALVYVDWASDQSERANVLPTRLLPLAAAAIQGADVTALQLVQRAGFQTLAVV